MKYRAGIYASSVLLLVSAVVLGVLQAPHIVDQVPFQWWVHVAVIGVAFWGFIELNRLRRQGIGHAANHLRFPAWAVAVGLAVILVALPIWSPSRFDMGTTPMGESVHHKHTSEKDGKYFLHLNRKHVQEITREEFLAFERDIYDVFARAWLVFSYLSLLMWLYLARRGAVQHAG